METRQKSPTVLPLIESEGAMAMTGTEEPAASLFRQGALITGLPLCHLEKVRKEKPFLPKNFDWPHGIETPEVEKGKRKLVMHCFIGPDSPADVCTINQNGPSRFKDKMREQVQAKE